MGLTIRAKGLTENYDCGYLTHGHFCVRLAYAAYGEKMGSIYEGLVFQRKKMSSEELDYWNTHCDDRLDLFLFHSDCDGKLSPKECRAIYKSIENLSIPMVVHNYHVLDKPYNLLERWKTMLKHCATRRVNLYFE